MAFEQIFFKNIFNITLGEERQYLTPFTTPVYYYEHDTNKM